MTKAELVAALAKAAGLEKKQAASFIESMPGVVGTALRKEKRLSIPGLGTYNVKRRKARTGRNPQTGAEIKIKASNVVSFKAAPALKTRVG